MYLNYDKWKQLYGNLIPEILNYYHNHSFYDTQTTFKLSHRRLMHILVETNTELHSKQEIAEFKTNKIKQTCLSKYGVPFNTQRQEFLASKQNYIKNTTTAAHAELIKQGFQNKYGVDNCFQVDEVKDKIAATMRSNHNGLWNSQTEEYNKKCYRKYVYDNLFFDSKPELCFYLYHKQLGHDIKRSPIRFEFDYNNETHYCFPDFEVDNKLYEIKGDHLYKRMQLLGSLDNAKLNCLLAHQVTIITSSEYIKYEKWAKQAGYNISQYLYSKEN